MSQSRAFFLVVVVAFLTAGCLPGHLVYHSESYRGRVVDAETKQLLAGAVVVAVWHREAALFGGHGPAEDYHDAVEVLTDAQGEFAIPGRTHVTWIGRIREPKLVVYYPGYVPYPELGTRPGDEGRRIAYQRKVFEIELPRIRTREERGRHADRPAGLDHRVPESKIPTLMTLINKERLDLGLRPIGKRD